MKGRYHIALLVLVFAPALLIRLHPVTSESFTYDAIVSQTAARDGFVANAWDEPETYQNRRTHPPLLSYIIIVNNAVAGDDEFRARLYSILAGALACLVVAMSVFAIGGRDKTALVGGVLGGWLMCLLPVHLYISRSANWDAVYSLFYTCSLLFLSLHLDRPRLRSLAWAGAFAVLAFLTCELGLSLLPAFVAVLVYDLRRRNRGQVLREWCGMIGVALVVTAVLWPAGVFKLDLLRTLRYRLYDSGIVERNSPWHGFYTTLFDQAPVYTFVAVAGVATALLLLLPSRRESGARQVDTGGVLVRLLPFAVYAVTVAALSFKQRLVYLHHIADLFPALTVVAVSAFVAASRAMTPFARAAGAALGICAVVLSAAAALNPDPRIVGPQEHPGFLGIRDFLEDHPGARTFYYYDYALRYYAPDADVTSAPKRWWTEEKLETVKSGDFEFVICDRTTLNDDFPTVEAVAAELRPDFEVVHTIHHRRTNEPVAWIFGRQPAD
jgi:hypothetical protein